MQHCTDQYKNVTERLTYVDVLDRRGSLNSRKDPQNHVNLGTGDPQIFMTPVRSAFETLPFANNYNEDSISTSRDEIPTCSQLEESISTDELDFHIANLKNNKSPGEDGIVSEILRRLDANTKLVIRGVGTTLTLGGLTIYTSLSACMRAIIYTRRITTHVTIVIRWLHGLINSIIMLNLKVSNPYYSLIKHYYWGGAKSPQY